MSGVVIVNFAYPLTDAQRGQIERLCRASIERVIDVPVQVDDGAPFAPQVATLIAVTGLSPVDWQTLPLVVNLPSYAPVTAVLLTQLHGLMGHFPTILRLGPVPGALPPIFHIAEVIDLNAARTGARRTRYEGNATGGS